MITFADGRSAIYCRMRADVQTRTTKQSLWRTDDSGPPRPMEAGEPDAFSPQLSPDGKWILFLSTRGFSDGTPAFEPVPPYSDTAADPLTPMQFRRGAVKSEFLAVSSEHCESRHQMCFPPAHAGLNSLGMNIDEKQFSVSVPTLRWVSRQSRITAKNLVQT